MLLQPPRPALLVIAAVTATVCARAGDPAPPSPELMAGAKVLVPWPSELIHSLRSANIAKWNESLAEVPNAGSLHRFDTGQDPCERSISASA